MGMEKYWRSTILREVTSRWCTKRKVKSSLEILLFISVYYIRKFFCLFTCLAPKTCLEILNLSKSEEGSWGEGAMGLCRVGDEEKKLQQKRPIIFSISPLCNKRMCNYKFIGRCVDGVCWFGILSIKRAVMCRHRFQLRRVWRSEWQKARSTFIKTNLSRRLPASWSAVRICFIRPSRGREPNE